MYWLPAVCRWIAVFFCRGLKKCSLHLRPRRVQLLFEVHWHALSFLFGRSDHSVDAVFHDCGVVVIGCCRVAFHRYCRLLLGGRRCRHGRLFAFAVPRYCCWSLLLLLLFYKGLRRLLEYCLRAQTPPLRLGFLALSPVTLLLQLLAAPLRAARFHSRQNCFFRSCAGAGRVRSARAAVRAASAISSTVRSLISIGSWCILSAESGHLATPWSRSSSYNQNSALGHSHSGRVSLCHVHVLRLPLPYVVRSELPPERKPPLYHGHRGRGSTLVHTSSSRGRKFHLVHLSTRGFSQANAIWSKNEEEKRRMTTKVLWDHVSAEFRKHTPSFFSSFVCSF